jgi:hypothetical protein
MAVNCPIKGQFGFRSKIFCLRGHDTSIRGRGKDSSCRECNKSDGPINARKPRTRFTSAKFGAKRRNLVWNITFEQYLPLINSLCFYCGGKLSETSCGLDRIDNTIGYEYNNVVPCCRICNVMKNNLTKDQFMMKIKDIYMRICL